uniref:glycosyl hydrolase 108 family protein n=1 Tax=Tenacibaculum piscium TaxID=1458515 RepID=UPI001F2088F0
MANYQTFQKKIQRAEGGYQILKTDSGNYNSLKQLVGTNFGVSAKVYERNIGRPPSIADMKNI